MQRIDRYELGAPLAQGPAGGLFRARDPSSGREVCLRLLSPEFAAQPALREQLLREAAALDRLRHANIVSVRAEGEAGCPYLVLDTIPERTLAGQIDARPLAPREAAELLRKLALALEHAHHNGILHRDVRPANVLLDAADEPRLAGFGLCFDLDPASSGLLGGRAGLSEPGFAAPELLAGGGAQVGPAVDVYGLGATLYAALCGKPPIAATRAEDVLARHRSRGVRPLGKRVRDLDPQLEAVVQRCLAPDPRERFASAEAVARALARFLLQPSRSTTTRGARAVAPSASSRLLVPLVLAGSIVLGLGGGLLLRGAGSAPAEPGPTSPPASVGEPALAVSPPLESTPLPTPSPVVRVAVPAPSPSAGEPAPTLTPSTETAEALLATAAAARERRDLAAAQQAYRKVCRMFPGQRRAWVACGSVCYDLGEFAPASQEFGRALQLGENDPTIWYGFAQALRRAGARDEALRAYRRTADLDPRHADALNWVSALLLDEGRYEEAVEWATRTLRADPNMAHGYYNRGTAFLHLGREQEALDDFDRALQLQPGKHTAHFNRAETRRRLGDVPGALQDYAAVIALDPDDPRAHRNRAKLLLARGEFAEALAGFDRALEQGGEDLELRILRAEALSGLGRQRDAIRELERLRERAQPEHAARIQELLQAWSD